MWWVGDGGFRGFNQGTDCTNINYNTIRLRIINKYIDSEFSFCSTVYNFQQNFKPHGVGLFHVENAIRKLRGGFEPWVSQLESFPPIFLQILIDCHSMWKCLYCYSLENILKENSLNEECYSSTMLFANFPFLFVQTMVLIALRSLFHQTSHSSILRKFTTWCLFSS